MQHRIQEVAFHVSIFPFHPFFCYQTPSIHHAAPLNPCFPTMARHVVLVCNGYSIFVLRIYSFSPSSHVFLGVRRRNAWRSKRILFAREEQMPQPGLFRGYGSEGSDAVDTTRARLQVIYAQGTGEIDIHSNVYLPIARKNEYDKRMHIFMFRSDGANTAREARQTPKQTNRKDIPAPTHPTTYLLPSHARCVF